MNFHSRYSAVQQPVETCVAGSGAFGRSFIAQCRFSRLVSARIAVDLSAEAAGEALAAAGLPRDRIRLCATASEARIAWDSGDFIATGALEIVNDLPFDMLVEATGHPEAAARHALQAIDARHHILMVTKETDSVAGPLLARLAREAGVGMTPVDGDQPALLIDLITWAETLGFDILAAGKSSEYDFIFQASTGQVTCNGVSAMLPALSEYWHSAGSGLREVAGKRAEILGTAFALRAVPDLCELTVVANATGLVPDCAALHAPPARIPELADLFSIAPVLGILGHGVHRHGVHRHGVLAGTRRLDVFHHLRAPDEASFAGGVFVTLACQDRVTWQVLAEKGHVVSQDGGTAMIYLPRHLLGLEAATSVLDLVGFGQSGYGEDYRPRTDLVAVATRDLAAGTSLTALGHHHTIDGVGAEMRPMCPIRADSTVPYYLVANRILARAVRSGDAIRLSDLVIAPDSALLDLRLRQDEIFA